MSRWILVALLFLAVLPRVATADDAGSASRYMNWLSRVDAQRASLAEAIRKELPANPRERNASAVKFSRTVKLLAANYKRTKPAVPAACSQMDRLYGLALEEEVAYAEAAIPSGLDSRIYGQNPKIVAGIKEEQKDLEGAIRELGRADTQHKGKVSAMTMLPLPGGQ